MLCRNMLTTKSYKYVNCIKNKGRKSKMKRHCDSEKVEEHSSAACIKLVQKCSAYRKKFLTQPCFLFLK